MGITPQLLAAVFVTQTLAGAVVGWWRGRPVVGLLLGLVLSWPGVILAALVPRRADEDAGPAIRPVDGPITPRRRP